MTTQRRYLLILTCGLALMLTGHMAGAADLKQPQSWNMREAVRFALLSSPDSRIAAQRIAAASALRQQAASAFLPRLNLGAGYQQTDNPMYSFGNILNQGTFSNNIDFNDPGRTDNLNLQAELRYRLYNGGQDQAGLQAAEARYASSVMDRNAIWQQLGYEVVRAFQSIVQAEDQVEARQAELEAIQASLSVAVARYEAGDLLKADMLKFEVQEAVASENLIAARHELEIAQVVFLNLLGLQQGSVTIENAEIVQQVPEPGDYRQRPELIAVARSVAAAEAQLAQAEGARYPEIDSFASYQYDKGFVDSGSGDSWMAGLRLNYKLYDGGDTAAVIAEKRAEHEVLKGRLAKLDLAVDRERQEAVLTYRQALERRSVTEKMVSVARESAQLSRERFRQGVILSSDLIEVELQLTDALVRQSAARANYQIAIANLRLAAGLQQYAATTEELLETTP